MYCAFVETTGVSGVVGVDGVEGVDGVDGVEGVELSGEEFSASSDEESSLALSEEVGGVELGVLSAVSQANTGSKKLSARSSAAKDFAFFIKIPHKVNQAVYRFVLRKIKRCIQR